MFRGFAHIPPFFLVNSCDGWKIIFIASCLDLHEHQFAVLVGNDVDFVVVAAPVSAPGFCSFVRRGRDRLALRPRVLFRYSRGMASWVQKVR